MTPDDIQKIKRAAESIKPSVIGDWPSVILSLIARIEELENIIEQPSVVEIRQRAHILELIATIERQEKLLIEHASEEEIATIAQAQARNAFSVQCILFGFINMRNHKALPPAPSAEKDPE